MRTRRDMLAFSSGAVAARTILPAVAKAEGTHRWPHDLFPPGHHPRLDPHPDTALLAACAAFHQLEASRPLDGGGGLLFGTPECQAHEKMQDTITGQQSDMVDTIAEMPAATRHGLLAKIAVLRVWNADELKRIYPGTLLTVSILDALDGSDVA